jgi:hypothetical protein
LLTAFYQVNIGAISGLPMLHSVAFKGKYFPTLTTIFREFNWPNPNRRLYARIAELITANGRGSALRVVLGTLYPKSDCLLLPQHAKPNPPDLQAAYPLANASQK